MATPTPEEIQQSWEEETEYTTPQEDLEDTYADIVEAGNNDDSDEVGNNDDSDDDGNNDDSDDDE